MHADSAIIWDGFSWISYSDAHASQKRSNFHNSSDVHVCMFFEKLYKDKYISFQLFRENFVVVLYAADEHSKVDQYRHS